MEAREKIKFPITKKKKEKEKKRTKENGRRSIQLGARGRDHTRIWKQKRPGRGGVRGWVDQKRQKRNDSRHEPIDRRFLAVATALGGGGGGGGRAGEGGVATPLLLVLRPPRRIWQSKCGAGSTWLAASVARFGFEGV